MEHQGAVQAWNGMASHIRGIHYVGVLRVRGEKFEKICLYVDPTRTWHCTEYCFRLPNYMTAVGDTEF
jgi:hypothetical protein